MDYGIIPISYLQVTTVLLCSYLKQQDYELHQITVITMYIGQLLEIKKRIRDADLDGILVTSVDSYQGKHMDPDH